MKKYFLSAAIVAIVAIVIAGCVHHAPLSTEHALPIDPELLGLWERVPAESKGDPAEDMMMILRWSDTEYVVQYPRSEKGDYFRAYPVEIGGRRVVQAQSLGSAWGEIHEGDRVAFPVLSYRIVEGILAVSTLNPRVVDEHIPDSDTLREAFLANINRQDLFEPPAHFRRAEDR